jgi:hypothetical protein
MNGSADELIAATPSFSFAGKRTVRGGKAVHLMPSALTEAMNWLPLRSSRTKFDLSGGA